MNGRNESFLVSIFRKATGKKVDEIVPFAEGKEGEGGGETQLSAILSPWKIWILPETKRDALTSSRCERRLI